MSNLYKQYNIIEKENSVRMMDYNSMVDQKLEELIRIQKAAQSAKEKEFCSLGSVSPEAEVEVEEEDPTELLRKAKEEAEEIQSRARDEAGELIGSAKKRAEDILAQAKEDGHKAGYEAGLLQIKGELETEYSQKAKELQEQRRVLEEDYRQKRDELEPMLLDTILTVVEKVFHIRFCDKRDILLYLIGNALSNNEGCKAFRIRVGTGQRDFVESRRMEILDYAGCDVSIEVVSDLSFTDSQCVIETDTGIFDCSVDVQLENLMKDLRALCS